MAIIAAGTDKLVYQTTFGVAHFFEGYTALSITIGAVVHPTVPCTRPFRSNGRSCFAVRAAIGRRLSLFVEFVALDILTWVIKKENTT